MKKMMCAIAAFSALQIALGSEIDLMPRSYTLTFTDAGGVKTFSSSMDDLNEFYLSSTKPKVLSCVTEYGSTIDVEYYGQNFTLTHGSTTKYWYRYNNRGSSNNFGTFDGITNCTLFISGHAFQRILNNTRYPIQFDYGQGYHTNISAGCGISIPASTYYTFTFDSREDADIEYINAITKREVQLDWGRLFFGKLNIQYKPVEGKKMIYADLNDAIAGNLLYNDENKLLYSDRPVTNSCTISVSFPDWDLDICGYVVGHSEDENCVGWSWKSETQSLPNGLHARWLSGDKTRGGTEYVLIDLDEKQPSEFQFMVACNWYTNPAPHDVTIVAEDLWGNKVERTVTPTSDRQHTRAERNDPSATFTLTRYGYLKKGQ